MATASIGLRLRGSPERGLIVGGVMARGCDLCFPGLKAVIFVTGLCDDSCFYCPVGRHKLGHDVFYVNEVRVDTVEDALLEVSRIGAEGASLTGGDPLIAFHRSIELVKRLKEEFGDSFHIHLYTSGRYATREVLKALWRAGLDEIRFHPTHDLFLKRISEAKRHTGMSVGAEIPIAPGLEKWAIKVIKAVEAAGGDFVNLNEMEIVEPNARALLARGYKESKRRPFTVEGSLEAALRVLEWASENAKVPVHFCPASFKDSVQTRNRFARTARSALRWFEEETREGTVLWGEIRGPRPPGLGAPCREGASCLPPHRSLLEVLSARYGCKAYIVEAHPTPDRRPIIREEPVTPPDPRVEPV